MATQDNNIAANQAANAAYFANNPNAFGGAATVVATPQAAIAPAAPISGQIAVPGSSPALATSQARAAGQPDPYVALQSGQASPAQLASSSGTGVGAIPGYSLSTALGGGFQAGSSWYDPSSGQLVNNTAVPTIPGYTFDPASKTFKPNAGTTTANSNNVNTGQPSPSTTNVQPGSAATGLQMPNANAAPSGLNFAQGQAANLANPPKYDAQGNLVPGTGGLSAQGFSNAQASGQSAPQDAGSAKTAMAGFTPSAPIDNSKQIAAVNSALSADPGYQQLLADQAAFNSAANQSQSLTQTYTDLMAQAGIPALQTQAMNMNTIINGTEDDIRKEVQAAGGFATNSQVLGLASARNKTLIQNYNNLEQTITNAQNNVNTMIGLAQQDKQMALQTITTKLNIDQQVFDTQQKMQAAAKEGYNTILNAVGVSGLLTSLNNDPASISLAEQTLGLQPGQLTQLGQIQTNQTNLKAIQAAGVSTPYALTANGEVQNTSTGQGYTSEADFLAKTGRTIQQAQKLGLVSPIVPLDTQLQKTQLASAQADLALAPLKTQQLQAQIANTKANTADTYSQIQARADASNPDKVQQALEQQYRNVLVKEVSNRSGVLGTEDAKVAQANHLASLLNQYYDPKTGNYNVPTAQYGELVLGLAGMISKTGTPTDSQVDNINQKTLKGDINGALAYVTGSPQNGTTQDIIKNLADSINRQAQTAVSNRQAEVTRLEGLKPTDLSEDRAQALEAASLTPYNGIGKNAQGSQNQAKGSTMTINGATYVSDGTQWVLK